MTDYDHFNALTPEQAELLALLAEECGEVIQVVGKILRHGLRSTHPNGGASNNVLLERELGDVWAAIKMMVATGVVSQERITEASSDKMDRVIHYLHHYRYRAAQRR